MFTVEKDAAAVQTYEANWGHVDAADIRAVDASNVPEHEVMAADSRASRSASPA